MKLSEAIARVNKDDIDGVYEIDAFSSILNIQFYGYDKGIPNRLKQVFLTKWLCTDTWVGTRIYFLDNIPVAVSHQSARKSDEVIKFITENDAQRMKDFIFSLMQDEESGSIPVCNLDEEIGECFHVSYGGQLLHKEGFYQGFPAKVQKTYEDYADIKKWEVIEISYSDGQSAIFKEIGVEEFDIPLNIV